MSTLTNIYNNKFINIWNISLLIRFANDKSLNMRLLLLFLLLLLLQHCSSEIKCLLSTAINNNINALLLLLIGKYFYIYNPFSAKKTNGKNNNHKTFFSRKTKIKKKEGKLNLIKSKEFHRSHHHSLIRSCNFIRFILKMFILV